MERAYKRKGDSTLLASIDHTAEEITVVRRFNIDEMILCSICKNWLIYLEQNTTKVFKVEENKSEQTLNDPDLKFKFCSQPNLCNAITSKSKNSGILQLRFHLYTFIN